MRLPGSEYCLTSSPSRRWRVACRQAPEVVKIGGVMRTPPIRKALAMKTIEQEDPLPTWHAGEIALQSSAGVAERMAEVGKRAIRDHLIDQHRQFFPLLPFVVLGAVDRAGNAWATLRGGRPGFMRAADSHRLSIQVARDPRDPADAGMEDGDGLGLLGIDLFTRRRNRLNGAV